MFFTNARSKASYFGCGPQSTANKVLIKVVEFHNATLNENDKPMATNNINHRSQLVNSLAQLITQGINYQEYQKLPSESKKKFQEVLAVKLLDHIKDLSCTTTIHDKRTVHGVFYQEQKSGAGICFNYTNDWSDNYEKEDHYKNRSAQFPQASFENKKEISELIREAAREAQVANIVRVEKDSASKVQALLRK